MRQRYCGYGLPHSEHAYETQSNNIRTAPSYNHFYNAGDPVTYECPGYDEDTGQVTPDPTKDEGTTTRPATDKKATARQRELVQFYFNSWDRRFGRNGYAGRSEEVS